jgi:phospholipid-binding lipoprotein MlaA
VSFSTQSKITRWPGAICPRIICLAAIVALTGCAAQPKTADTASQAAAKASATPGDPFEATNRGVLKVNMALNRALVNPGVKGYRAVAPKPVRSMIGALTDLVSAPFTLVNKLLQGDARGVSQTLSRTLINATLGMGLFDRATEFGYPEQDEDFGQTLAVWGVPSGPYLMLPFLGPSTVRDLAGFGVQVVGDPVSIIFSQTGNLTASRILTAADLTTLLDRNIDNVNALEASSIDFYAALRSAYLQTRALDVRNGAADPNAELTVDPLEDEPQSAPPSP